MRRWLSQLFPLLQKLLNLLNLCLIYRLYIHVEKPVTVKKIRMELNSSSDIPWRRKWQPTPVFLPGESQGWGSLVGCRLWGRTESDTTEAT